MPLLKYSLYEKLVSTNLSEDELKEFIKAIYIISKSYLQYINNQHSSSRFSQNYIENIAINVTTSLLTCKNKNVFPLKTFLNKYQNKIISEYDFNYWLMKEVWERTEVILKIEVVENNEL